MKLFLRIVFLFLICIALFLLYRNKSFNEAQKRGDYCLQKVTSFYSENNRLPFDGEINFPIGKFDVLNYDEKRDNDFPQFGEGWCDYGTKVIDYNSGEDAHFRLNVYHHSGLTICYQQKKRIWQSCSTLN